MTRAPRKAVSRPRLPNTSATNTYVWWDSALQSAAAYKPDVSSSTTWTTTWTYNAFAQLTSVYIGDGRPRTVTYRSFRPYDPAQAIGDLSPTTPKPARNNKCGAFGQILLAVVAIAVTAIAPFGAGAVAGMANAALGSIASQAVGVASGIQSKFSFKGVAIAALSAGVSGGIAGQFGTGALAGSQIAGDVVRGAASSAIAQGIAVATGLQGKFSWAGVAAAGAAGGVGGAFKLDKLSGAGLSARNIAGHAGVGAARLIASAATRSAIEGTSFGDNIRAGLPDLIGQVVVQAIGGAISNARAARADGANARASGGSAATRHIAHAQQQMSSPVATTAQEPTQGQAAEDVVETGALPDAMRRYVDGGWSPNWDVYNERLSGVLHDQISLALQGQQEDWSRVEAALAADRARLVEADLLASTLFLELPNFSIASSSRSGSWGNVVGGGSLRAQTELVNARSAPAVLGAIGSGASYLYRGMFGPQTITGQYIIGPVNTTFGAIANSPLGDPGVIMSLEASGVFAPLGAGLSVVRGWTQIAGTTRIAQSVTGGRVLSIADDPLAVASGRVRAAEVIHGNSRLSPRTAYLYELSTTDGTFLKYGVSQNPAKRYLRTFMEGKLVEPIASGSRAEMLTLERQMVTHNPGPLNFEPWAVKTRAGLGQ